MESLAWRAGADASVRQQRLHVLLRRAVRGCWGAIGGRGAVLGHGCSVGRCHVEASRWAIRGRRTKLHPHT